MRTKMGGFQKSRREIFIPSFSHLPPLASQRKTEIRTISGANEFSEFYHRLKEIKEHHRKYPHETVDVLELEIGASANPEEEEANLEAKFTGEEAFGKYLDLHEQHEMFLNLAPAKADNNGDNGGEERRMTYLEYLSEFDKFEAIPKSVKYRTAYEKYLESLRNYLESWFERAQPLYDLESLQTNAAETFEKLWETGMVPGWSSTGQAEGSEGLFCAACGFFGCADHSKGTSVDF